VLRAKASLEVTKEMRSRIPAAVGLVALVGLLPAAPLRAQAPSATQAQVQAPALAPGGTLQLSLDDAVKRALDNNNDIAVARFNPELSEQSIFYYRGNYDPYLFSNLNHSSTDTKGTSAFSGGTTVNNKRDVWNFGVSAPIQATGGSLSVAFNNNKQDTTNVFSTYNPVYNSSLNFNLTQPLLRNLKIDSSRNQLRIAKKNREISDVAFHATIVNTVANVKGYYYDLIYAFDNLEAARQNLELAKKLLNENEIRVKVGTMAPLDVVTAQAEVASREVDVITAENTLAQAQDNLKQAIFPANDPAMWGTQIVPVDRPSADPMPVDIEAAVKNALLNRTDVVTARKNLEISDYNIQYSKGQLLPQLDLVAAYGASGAGGTQLIRDGLGGPVISTVPGGYGDALDQVFGRDYPTWTVGATISYSIPNRSAKASSASARIAKDQALTSFRRLELQVAADVRTTGRNVESGFKTVQSTKAARVLAEQRLDAEEKKFAAGMSTNYLVTQAQRDLAIARVNELRATSEYRKAQVNFQRVQEAGISASTAGSAILTAARTSSASSSVTSSSGF
jgi:outer membrane protein TolC